MKLIIPLFGNDVAPRFDLATEILIRTSDENGSIKDEKMIVLPQSSADQLCQLILTNEIKVVICGGIEEEYYQYLKWKKVIVIDDIIGNFETVLKKFYDNQLKPGDIFYPQESTTPELKTQRGL